MGPVFTFLLLCSLSICKVFYTLLQQPGLLLKNVLKKKWIKFRKKLMHSGPRLLRYGSYMVRVCWAVLKAFDFILAPFWLHLKVNQHQHDFYCKGINLGKKWIFTFDNHFFEGNWFSELKSKLSISNLFLKWIYFGKRLDSILDVTWCLSILCWDV